MDVSQLNRSRVNESRLNCSVLNASGFDGACRRSRVPGIGADIMKSMVLWYDIAKQGATNESMAENPVLRDLSGNGHDATCYNFAWSGMSGIGGYKTNYTRYFKYSNRVTTEVTDAKIVVTSISVNGAAFIETINTDLGLIPAYKIKVSGIPDGTMLRYTYFLEESNSVKQFYNMQSDGEYELPANTYLNKNVGFLVTNFTGECNITIEQLPLYPNALVSDGVDDRCLVEGLPNIHSLFIKYSGLGQASTSWKYLYNTEISGAEDTDRWYCATDPGSGNLVSVPSISDIGYAQKVNDIVTNNRVFEIFHYHGGGNGAFALYSLILFNHTLTTEEIEWVKTNLIETEQ